MAAIMQSIPSQGTDLVRSREAGARGEVAPRGLAHGAAQAREPARDLAQHHEAGGAHEHQAASPRRSIWRRSAASDSKNAGLASTPTSTAGPPPRRATGAKAERRSSPRVVAVEPRRCGLASPGRGRLGAIGEQRVAREAGTLVRVVVDERAKLASRRRRRAARRRPAPARQPRAQQLVGGEAFVPFMELADERRVDPESHELGHADEALGEIALELPREPPVDERADRELGGGHDGQGAERQKGRTADDQLSATPL